MDWSIDLERKHCAHPMGLSAFIDTTFSANGQIRCLGPFGSEGLSIDVVSPLIASLTLVLENLFRGEGCIVVWGAYSESAIFHEHKFPIMDSTCGFLPNPLLREKLLIHGELTDPHCAWEVSSSKIWHQLGLIVDLCSEVIDASNIQPEFILPDCAEWQIRTLAGLAARRFINSNLERFRLNLGALKWSQTAPQLTVVR